MNKSRTGLIASSISLSVVFLPLAFQNVQAYIDLGAGSLIIQLLIAGLVGGLFLVKIYWKKVKAFFKRFFSSGGKTKG